MTTGTAGTAAREYPFEMVHFIRKDIAYTDGAVTVTVGTIPAGSVMLKPASGVNVSTVFNFGTNNRLDIGTAATADLYGTDLSLLTAGFVPLDEAVSQYVAVDTTIKATLDVTGTAGTTGVAQIVIAYVPNI